MNSCVRVGCRNSSTTSSALISRNRAPLESFFTLTTSGRGEMWFIEVNFSIALIALVRMSASEEFPMLWPGVFGTLLIRTCLARK